MYQQAPSDPPKSLATGFPVTYNSTTTTYSSSTTDTSYAPPPPPQPKPIVQWSTGLCDCCSDRANCKTYYCSIMLMLMLMLMPMPIFSGCITCWCPCVTFGRVTEIVDKGSTSCGASGALYTLICCVIGCACLYSCFYRSKMRRQYGLKGNACTDCLLHCCCEYCVLCQEYRELQNRGFDMIIGWHGNVEQRSRGVAMTAAATAAPSVEQGMTR